MRKIKIPKIHTYQTNHKVKYFLQGMVNRQRISVTGDTEEEVTKKYLERYNILLDTYGDASALEGLNQHTVKDVCQLFFDTKVKKLSNKKTQDQQEKYLDFFIKTVGGRRISTLQYGELESLREDLREKIRGSLRSKNSSEDSRNQTLNKYFDCFFRAIENARKRGWKDCQGVPQLDRLKTKKLPIPEYTEDQLRELVRLAYEEPTPHFGVIVEVALLTGLRKNEIRFLLKSNINFDKNTITIPNTKNGKPHTLIMPEPLRGLMLEQVNKVQGELLFPSKKNPRAPIVFEKTWRKIRQQISGFENLRVHDLRKIYATNLIEYGSSIEDTSNSLNHSDISITKRIYAGHQDQSRLRIKGTVEKVYENLKPIHETKLKRVK